MENEAVKTPCHPIPCSSYTVTQRQDTTYEYYRKHNLLPRDKVGLLDNLKLKMFTNKCLKCQPINRVFLKYRSGTVNSNTVNSKFHFIRSFCEMLSYHFPIISCSKCTVHSKFHLIRRKSLPTKDFKLTVPDL